jgi:ketosteroid isomerase-like protein
MSEQNLALIRRGYEAFGQGDLEGLIDTMDPNVEWVSPGPSDLPTAGTRRGQAAVREFFGMINELFQFESFEPHTFVAEGDRVIVLGVDTVKVKATGNVLSEHWAHAFTVRGGKVVAFREYIDTAATVAELRGARAEA